MIVIVLTKKHVYVYTNTFTFKLSRKYIVNGLLYIPLTDMYIPLKQYLKKSEV